MRDQDRGSSSLNLKNQSSYLHVRDHQGYLMETDFSQAALTVQHLVSGSPPAPPLPDQGQPLFQRPVCLQAGHGSGGSFWLSRLCQQELSLRSRGVSVIGVSIFSESLHKPSLKEAWVSFFFLRHSFNPCILTGLSDTLSHPF